MPLKMTEPFERREEAAKGMKQQAAQHAKWSIEIPASGADCIEGEMKSGI
jgi:hypothetical protein